MSSSHPAAVARPFISARVSSEPPAAGYHGCPPARSRARRSPQRAQAHGSRTSHHARQVQGMWNPLAHREGSRQAVSGDGAHRVRMKGRCVDPPSGPGGGCGLPDRDHPRETTQLHGSRASPIRPPGRPAPLPHAARWASRPAYDHRRGVPRLGGATSGTNLSASGRELFPQGSCH